VDKLPDLTGQPPWVIVVVVGLTALGTLGGAILQRGEKRRKRRRRAENDDDPAIDHRHRVPSLPSGQADVLGVSVNAIIEHARRESEEAAEARAETRALQARYEQAIRELEEARRTAQRALADLGHCQAHVERLRSEMNGGGTK
jgi:Flp pilus assembly protein TadB